MKLPKELESFLDVAETAEEEDTRLRQEETTRCCSGLSRGRWIEESLGIEYNPRFLRIIETARKEVRAGKTISLAALEKKFAWQRLATGMERTRKPTSLILALRHKGWSCKEENAMKRSLGAAANYGFISLLVVGIEAKAAEVKVLSAIGMRTVMEDLPARSSNARADKARNHVRLTGRVRKACPGWRNSRLSLSFLGRESTAS